MNQSKMSHTSCILTCALFLMASQKSCQTFLLVVVPVIKILLLATDSHFGEFVIQGLRLCTLHYVKPEGSMNSAVHREHQRRWSCLGKEDSLLRSLQLEPWFSEPQCCTATGTARSGTSGCIWLALSPHLQDQFRNTPPQGQAAPP